MSRTAMLGLSMILGFSSVTTPAAQAQVRSTLDAQFPSAHRYTIEVWFMKKDKAGTFKAQFYDPSVPGQYNARQWEDFRTKMNDPNVGGVSRKIEFTTREGVRQTEREQIEARIKQERDRIEFQDPKFVDSKPERLKETKTNGKGESKRFGYDDNATKLVGTRWFSSFDGELSDTVLFEFGEKGAFIWKNPDGTPVPSNRQDRWVIKGDILEVYERDEYPLPSFEGRIKGDRIDGTGYQWDGTGKRHSPHQKSYIKKK